MRKTDYQRNHQIATAYQSGQFLTEHIAKRFGISRRRVQQIAKDYGIVRTQSEGSRVATPLKSQRRLRLR